MLLKEDLTRPETLRSGRKTKFDKTSSLIRGKETNFILEIKSTYLGKFKLPFICPFFSGSIQQPHFLPTYLSPAEINPANLSVSEYSNSSLANLRLKAYEYHQITH